MSRWFNNRRYLSKEKRAELKKLREDDAAWRTEFNAGRAKLEENRRVDARVHPLFDEGLDRDTIATRTGLNKFAIALSERRYTGEAA